MSVDEPSANHIAHRGDQAACETIARPRKGGRGKVYDLLETPHVIVGHNLALLVEMERGREFEVEGRRAAEEVSGREAGQEPLEGPAGGGVGAVGAKGRVKAWG